MEATVFNSQETPSDLFTPGELETGDIFGFSHGTIATYERLG